MSLGKRLDGAHYMLAHHARLFPRPASKYTQRIMCYMCCGILFYDDPCFSVQTFCGNKFLSDPSNCIFFSQVLCRPMLIHRDFIPFLLFILHVLCSAYMQLQMQENKVLRTSGSTFAEFQFHVLRVFFVWFLFTYFSEQIAEFSRSSDRAK